MPEARGPAPAYLVIGASGAIGSAVVTRLRKLGHPVIGVGGSRIPRNCDNQFALKLRRPADIERLGRKIRALRQDLLGFVYAAGLGGDHTAFSSILEWQDLMLVNTIAPCVLAWDLRRKLARARGHVVTVGSVAGHMAVRSAAYGASKSALVGGIRSLAWWLAPMGIRVNAVCPGPVLGGQTAKWSRRERADRIERTAMKRFGNADEIASVICFLLSREASWITGCAVDCSGGFELR